MDIKNRFGQRSRDYYKLRPGIHWAMTISFVITFVVVGWPLTLWIGNGLARVWQIDEFAPVRYQEHGTGWFVSFMLSFVLIVLVVGAVWYSILIAWLVLIRRWSVPAAYEAIVRCRYPQAWFKDNEVGRSS